MKKVFIGIDFSKLKFDAAIYSVDTKAIVATEVFENDQFCPCGYISINCLHKSAGWSVGFPFNPTSLYYEDFKSDRQIVFF